jgi:amidase
VRIGPRGALIQIAEMPHRVSVQRESFLTRAVRFALLVLSSLAISAHAATSDRSIQDLQQAMASGELTSESLVHYYLDRIEALDRQGPNLHAIIAVNPDAVDEARALDQERREHGPRGPLHGIPVLIKDNIETEDRVPTTAGSYALANNFADRDAPVVAALRAAGAVILGKTNLSEWADFRSSRATSAWSAVGGLTRNPYVLDRTPCGSSSGSAVAVAADLAAASIGTETDGSITCPASMNGIVGLKPTVGLISQQGIVPVAHSQDTAGPMGRSVADVAILLSAMAGASPHRADYVKALDPNALQGKRIGVLRFDPGQYPQLDIVYNNALGRLKAAGATLVEVSTPDLAPIKSAEFKVLLTEFKADLDRYLAGVNPGVKVRSLSQLIAYDRGSLYELELFGQDLFLQAEGTTGLDDPGYRAALERAKRLAGAQGIDRLLRGEQLDLLVAPTTTPAWRVDVLFGDRNTNAFTTLPAVAGYPHLSVPMGEVRGLPVGMSFIGPAWSEALLLACGYAFSTRSPAMEPPKFTPSLEAEEFGTQVTRGP